MNSSTKWLAIASLGLSISILILSNDIKKLQKDNQEIKLQIKNKEEQLEIFKKLSYSLAEYCIDLEKEHATCFTETKEYP